MLATEHDGCEDGNEDKDKGKQRHVATDAAAELVVEGGIRVEEDPRTATDVNIPIPNALAFGLHHLDELQLPITVVVELVFVARVFRNIVNLRRRTARVGLVRRFRRPLRISLAVYACAARVALGTHNGPERGGIGQRAEAS